MGSLDFISILLYSAINHDWLLHHLVLFDYFLRGDLLEQVFNEVGNDDKD